jgi:hypothetical protein
MDESFESRPLLDRDTLRTLQQRRDAPSLIVIHEPHLRTLRANTRLQCDRGPRAGLNECERTQLGCGGCGAALADHCHQIIYAWSHDG